MPVRIPIPCTTFSDRKSTRLNSSHTVIYTLSLHDALPIFHIGIKIANSGAVMCSFNRINAEYACENSYTLHDVLRSEEHTSELQSHRDLHSFPTRRSSDLPYWDQNCELRRGDVLF